MNAELKKHPPTLDQQIKWVAAYIIKLREQIQTDPQDWMEEDLRYQQAIYQSLLSANWVLEACTRDLLSLPSNQPLRHTKCWVPFYDTEAGRWTIVLIEVGVSGFTKHKVGDVDTEAEAIDWADNENHSQFDIDDDSIIQEIKSRTGFGKEAVNG